MLCISLYLFCIYFVLVLHCTIQVFKCQRTGGRSRWDQRGTNTFEATQEVTLPTIHSQVATLWDFLIESLNCTSYKLRVMINAVKFFLEIYSTHKRWLSKLFIFCLLLFVFLTIDIPRKQFRYS